MKINNFNFKIDDKCDIHKSGIYLITNIISHKVYVGQTRKPFIARWFGHQLALSYRKANYHFQNSYDKHGNSAFVFSIIEYLPDELQFIADCINRKEAIDKDTKKSLLTWLNNRENYWIRYYRKLLGDKNVYNRDDGAGKNPTNELRELRGKGVKRHYDDPEAHIKQSKAQQKRYERKEEHEKISRAVRKSFTENPERLRKQGASLKEFYNEDPQRRIDKSKEIKDRYDRPGEREKISLGNKRRFSDVNERRKMSEAQIKSYANNPERRLKQSETQKKVWSNPERRAKMKPLPKEACKKVSEAHKRNVKDPLKYENIYLKNAKHACEIRTAKYEKLRKCFDNILEYWYLYNYRDKLKLSVRGKLRLINELAEIIKEKYNSSN